MVYKEFKNKRGNAKEIRSFVKEFIELTKEGKFRKLNDFIMGCDENDEPLFCIQLRNSYEENLEEAKKINLKSKELKEIIIWQETGEGGIEYTYN